VWRRPRGQAAPAHVEHRAVAGETRFLKPLPPSANTLRASVRPRVSPVGTIDHELTRWCLFVPRLRCVPARTWTIMRTDNHADNNSCPCVAVTASLCVHTLRIGLRCLYVVARLLYGSAF
jgi:hypothetical protein